MGGIAALSLVFSLPALRANPTGGAVVAGSAVIGPTGKTLTINQSSNIAIINWQTFSIGSGETTKFFVPTSSSATLNRVLSGNPSQIYGTLSSNGQLFLINPSGIVVGPSGRIDTAGFLGSTLDVSDDQFLKSGNLTFAGSSTAGIDNQGSISATNGNVYLIADQVSNEGSLTAPQGSVGLAAGSSVLLEQAGDQHLFVQSNPIGTTRAVGISNAGTIHRRQRIQKSRRPGLSHRRHRRHRQRRDHPRHRQRPRRRGPFRLANRRGEQFGQDQRLRHRAQGPGRRGHADQRARLGGEHRRDLCPRRLRRVGRRGDAVGGDGQCRCGCR
jgi:filamentous hemagglutinin family protein